VAQPMLLIIVMLVSSPTPRLLPFSHRHRHWCCWRKMHSRFLAAPYTITLLSSSRCCPRQEAVGFVCSRASVDALDLRPPPRLRPHPPQPCLLRH
jgi:hypothetical protein